MTNYSQFSESFKVTPTATERWLISEHGDLHEVIIPRLNAGDTLTSIAEYLGVSIHWVSTWLARHGYERQYVRTEGGDA